MRVIVDWSSPFDGEPGDVFPWGEGEWWVCLPDCPRAVDHRGHAKCSWTTTTEAFDGSGRWRVTGDPRHGDFTVSPSINVLHFVIRDGTTVRDGSCWHGWIRNNALEWA